MSLHAFVDESYRAGTYIVCAVIVDSSRVGALRRDMRRQLKGSQGRVHMTKENNTNKRALVEHIRELKLSVSVVTVVVSDKSQRSARDACLAALTRELNARGVARMIVESCDQDREDRQIIGDELARWGDSRAIELQHLRAFEEPLLWAADIVAWAYGRSGAWRLRVASLISSEIRL